MTAERVSASYPLCRHAPWDLCSGLTELFFLLFVLSSYLWDSNSLSKFCLPLSRRGGVSTASKNTHPRPGKETVKNVLELWVQRGSGQGTPQMRGGIGYGCVGMGGCWGHRRTLWVQHVASREGRALATQTCRWSALWSLWSCIPCHHRASLRLAHFARGDSSEFGCLLRSSPTQRHIHPPCAPCAVLKCFVLQSSLNKRQKDHNLQRSVSGNSHKESSLLLCLSPLLCLPTCVCDF